MSVDLDVQPIPVDIWSDIACPWCYIGKRRFETALAAFSSNPELPPVAIEYHSFELSPDTPVHFSGGELAFLVQHKGIPAAEVRQMLEYVTELAAEVGLHYDFAKRQHTNTLLALQMLHFAKKNGQQLAACERLFKAYFEEGRHLGDPSELAVLGAQVGLDRAELLESLSRNEFLPAVRADQQRAADLQVRGVPFFLIDGRYQITGAADPAEFGAALEAVVADRVAPADTADTAAEARGAEARVATAATATATATE